MSAAAEVYPSKAEVLATAGRVLGAGLLRMLSMDPHEAAVAAHIPRVTPSVEELEARIRSIHAAAEARARAA